MRWFRRSSNGPKLAAGDPPAERAPVSDVEATQIGVPWIDAALRLEPSEGLELSDGESEQRWTMTGQTLSIGRGSQCQVTIGDPRVSRAHAELRRIGRDLWIEHQSRTNVTLLNDVRVDTRAEVFDGDRIALADGIVLVVDAPGRVRPERAASAGDSGRNSLRRVMEDRVDLEARIEREFVREGSFVDIDVVDSYGMKASETRPERIVVSFERFRSFVYGHIERGAGRVLNSNGDEVAAFFPRPDDAVRAALGLLSALAEFNGEQNALERDFRVRIGIHSGRSAIDFDAGIAYSPILDGAGHLQKAADRDGVLLSDETRVRLGEAWKLAPEHERDAELRPWRVVAD